MPCRSDGYEDYARPSSPRGADREMLESTLCGLFTFLEKNKVPVLNEVLDNLDYKEMGVSRKEVEAWWREHKREDENRRRREERARKKEELKNQALSKLTNEEKKALGIKP